LRSRYLPPAPEILAGNRAVHVNHHLLPQADAWLNIVAGCGAVESAIEVLDAQVRTGAGISRKQRREIARQGLFAATLRDGELW